MSLWNDVAGAADHLAGSTDEAVARTFDNEEGGGVIDGTGQAAANTATAPLDFGADFVNSSTGTGENLGWFGVADRQLDYRTLTGEMDADSDEWAEPTDETTGLSGAVRATSGQAGAAVEDAGEATLGDNWEIIAGVGLVILGYLAIQSSPAGMVVP
jgi:hypothetical protein